MSLSLGGALLLAACDTGDFNVRYVVGLNGLILKTTNAGSSWTQQTSGVTVTLNGVAFAGPNDGCAVGEKGTVIWTSDGSTWNAAASVPTTKELNAVDAPTSGSTPAASTQLVEGNTNGAFAVGKTGTIIYSPDHCNNWVLQSSGTTRTLNGVATCRCGSDAWAVGDNGTIVATFNLGSTWSPQSSGVKSDLLAVSFADSTHGWAVGAGGVILNTTNGGTTWTKQKSNTKHTLEGVAFASDASHGYAVGDDGVIVATTDGGNTWAKQSTHTTTPFDSVSTIFLSGTTGNWKDAIAVGSNGLIEMTTDGGVTWTKSNPGTTTSLEGTA